MLIYLAFTILRWGFCLILNSFTLFEIDMKGEGWNEEERYRYKSFHSSKFKSDFFEVESKSVNRQKRKEADVWILIFYGELFIILLRQSFYSLCEHFIFTAKKLG